jgi:type II secretory pathway pseudopilin PulG
MRNERGFSLLELLVVVATVLVLCAIAIPMFQEALLRANTSSLSTDAKAIYVAIKSYYVDNNTYPATADFGLGTFEPLIGMGYLGRNVVTRLRNLQADAYLGNQTEFWLELTLRTNHSVRFLVADSINAPLGGGDYRDGIYVFVDGNETQIGQAH